MNSFNLTWRDIGLRVTWRYRAKQKLDKLNRRGRRWLSKMGLVKRRAIMDNFPHWVIPEDHTANMTHIVGNFLTQRSTTPDGYTKTGESIFFD